MSTAIDGRPRHFLIENDFSAIVYESIKKIFPGHTACLVWIRAFNLIVLRKEKLAVFTSLARFSPKCACASGRDEERRRRRKSNHTVSPFKPRGNTRYYRCLGKNSGFFLLQILHSLLYSIEEEGS